MKHNGWHLWIEPEQGETRELTYLALGIAAVRLAEPDEEAAAEVREGGLATGVASAISGDDQGMHLLTCGDRYAGVRLSAVTGSENEFELDLDLYESDCQTLLDLTAALLRVLTILDRAGRL